MPTSQPPSIDNLINETLDDLKVSETRQTAARLLREAFGLLQDRPDSLNLKIATAAVEEMRDAFEMFAPYTDVPKVTIFGSARTAADDPLYRHAEEVARAFAAQGWMVVTGAGPGIMEAGMRGAGRSKSIGVSIRLPFESGANSVIAGDDKHVSMKYFFTRKLMLIKESAGFVSLPGGFGTLDETFELLTLTQTGKGLPVPIVFHDVPSTEVPGYWSGIDAFVRSVLIPRGLVSSEDVHLYHLSTEPADTVAHIVDFYANYHSIRFVGDVLVIRIRRPPTEDQLASINRDFGDLLKSGSIEVIEATAPERAESDHVDLARLALSFDRHGFAELRGLIDRINTW